MNITWGVIVDRLSVTMIGLVTFVALLVQVYSVAYMRGEPQYGWYFAAHALFAAAMLTLVLADNLVFLYLAWELVGLGSYLLIGFWHERRPAAEAAKKAFVTTRIGDVGLLIGIILLYRATGTFDISGVIHAVENGVGAGLISTGHGEPRDAPRVPGGDGASRHSSPSTSGCPTPWRARRRLAR